MLYISEHTTGMNFNFSHNFCIPFEIVVSNFQSFHPNNVKTVTILVNLYFRTFFDIFSHITQKPLCFFFSELSLFRVKKRWKLVQNHYRNVCNFKLLFMKNAFLGRSFSMFQHFFTQFSKWHKTTRFSLNLLKPRWKRSNHFQNRIKFAEFP